MQGSVSISLADFKKLEKQAEVGVQAKDVAEMLDFEISALLSFMAAHVDMKKIAEVYNTLPDRKFKLEIIGEACRLVRKK